MRRLFAILVKSPAHLDEDKRTDAVARAQLVLDLLGPLAELEDSVDELLPDDADEAARAAHEAYLDRLEAAVPTCDLDDLVRDTRFLHGATAQEWVDDVYWVLGGRDCADVVSRLDPDDPSVRWLCAGDGVGHPEVESDWDQPEQEEPEGPGFYALVASRYLGLRDLLGVR